MVKQILHRGFSSEAPENTLPAFELATQVYGIETDIWLTKDQQWVIMHDDTIDRMTNGSGTVRDFTYEQLLQFRIDTGAHLADFPILRIPKLTEYLALVKRNQGHPIIEIKDGDDSQLQAVLDFLHAYKLYDKAVIISFHYEILQRMRHLDSTIPLEFLVEHKLVEADFQKAVELGNAGLDLEYILVNQQVVDHAHNLQLPVNVWTINSPEVFSRMVNLGVDEITGNYRFVKNS